MARPRRLALLLALCSTAAARNIFLNECPSGALGSWLDMSSWVQAGTAPRWEVMDGGRTIKQYVNSPDPGFYISDRSDYIDFVLKGTITIDEQNNPDASSVGIDNDFVGFLVGMQKPLPDDLHNYDGMIFAWGGVERSQSHGWQTLHKLNGSIPPDTGGGHASGWEGECFWHRTNGNWRRTSIAAPSGSMGKPQTGRAYQGLREGVGCYDISINRVRGWSMRQTYTFQVLFTEDVMKVSVDGKVVVSVTQQDVIDSCLSPDRPLPQPQFQYLTAEQKKLYPAATSANCQEKGKAWRKGRLAWYNLSQHGVRYGNIRMFKLADIQSGTTAPFANEDIFGIIRTPDGDRFEPSIHPFYEGVLGNDWSPELRQLEPMLPSQFGQDPLKDGAIPTNTVAVCQHGSTIKVDSSGGFHYEPNQDMIARVDAEEINVEYCHYRARDNTGEWSNLQNITFALQPRSLVGLEFDIHWVPDLHDLDWYYHLEIGSKFGELVANGSCIRIVDWRMTDSAGGKFRLEGQNIVANRPDELTVGFKARQHYVVTVVATSIFGLTQEKDVIIDIPARCELLNACVCSDYICKCKYGFEGENCDECIDNRMDIAQNPNCTQCLLCPLANGTGLPAAASDGSITGRCMYPEEACNVFCHREVTCSGHGECVDTSFRPGECDCDEGWAGAACDECDVDYYNVTGECKYCQEDESCGSVGTCDPMTAECICQDRWGGPGCQYCADPFYFPPDCNQSCTRDKNCSGNGECVNVYLHYDHKCECDVGWSGEWTVNGCNVTCSRETSCSNHGDCALDGGNWSCACDNGPIPGVGKFDGDDCSECAEYYYPDGVCNKFCSRDLTCNGRGDCDENGECICDPGSWSKGWYTGQFCDKCVEGYYPPYQCNVPCSRGLNCSGSGNCDAIGYCDCDPGFTGVACNKCYPGYYPPGKCDQFCDAEVTCSAHGDCMDDGSCRCHEHWHGEDCSKYCSDALTCNMNGVCDPHGDCICDPTFAQTEKAHCLMCIADYYPYKVCDTYCAPDSCVHGVCSEKGHCLCDWGWGGENCTDVVTPMPTTASPPTEVPSTPEPTNATSAPDTGAAEEEEEGCAMIEIAGFCAGWLLLALLALLCCLALLAAYLLSMKKKKKRRRTPQKEQPAPVPAADPLMGMGATLSNYPTPEPAAQKLGPGSLAGQETIPIVNPPQAPLQGVAGATLATSPSPMLQGTSAPALAASPAPLLRGLSGATLATSPSPPANDAPGFRLGPGNTAGQEEVPLLAATQASLVMSVPAQPAFKLGPGNTAGQEEMPEVPLLGTTQPSLMLSRAPSDSALLAGRAASPLAMAPSPTEQRRNSFLSGVASPQLTTRPSMGGANGGLNGRKSPLLGVTAPPRSRSSSKVNFGQANAGLPPSVSASPSPPDVLASSLPRGVGPPSPSAERVKFGAQPDLLGGLLAAGGASSTTGGPPRARVGAAGLLGVTRPDSPSHLSNTVRSAKDFGPASLDGPAGANPAPLVRDPTHLAAAAAGAVPAAVRDVVERQPPSAVSPPLQRAIGDFDKAQGHLERVMAGVAKDPATGPEIKRAIESAQRGDWGLADLDGFGVDPRAVNEAGFTEVARGALLTPPHGAADGGMSPAQRQQLAQAVAAADKSRAGVVAAARDAVASPAVPQAAEDTLRRALGTRDAMQDARQQHLPEKVREAAARGRVVDAAEKAAGHPHVAPQVRQQLHNALKDANGAERDLERAVARVENPVVREYMRTANDDAAWSAGDLGGMEPLVRKGRGVVAAKQALQSIPMSPVDRRVLEDAVRRADAAHADLVSAGRAVLAADPPGAVAAPLTAAVGATNGDKMFKQMDPLQRAAAVRGQLPATLQHNMGRMDTGARTSLHQPMAAYDAARKDVDDEVRRCLDDPSLPPAACDMLRQAVDGATWGPACDLSGMDPIMRNALANGQTAAAAGVVHSQPDVPPAVRDRLGKVLASMNRAENDLKRAAQKVVDAPNPEGGVPKNAIEAAMNPWRTAPWQAPRDDVLADAAVKGPVLVAVEKTLAVHPHPALAGASRTFVMQQQAFAGAVRGVLPRLPANAAKQLGDAVAGVVNFTHGAAPQSANDPLQPLLLRAVEGVLASGGAGGAEAAALRSAAQQACGASDALNDAVRGAIAAPTPLPESSRRDLQAALYGKVHPRPAVQFGGADIDLTSAEFAPIGFGKNDASRPPMDLTLAAQQEQQEKRHV